MGAEASVTFTSADFVSGLAPSDLVEPFVVANTDFEALEPELDETWLVMELWSTW